MYPCSQLKVLAIDYQLKVVLLDSRVPVKHAWMNVSSITIAVVKALTTMNPDQQDLVKEIHRGRPLASNVLDSHLTIPNQERKD